ncbi:hypothetical protein N7461_005375 [Penicillium sp. DV-2018c]|nr:hypothetical protein N7461_005375 [Penicillium sp. DV-2018c]
MSNASAMRLTKMEPSGRTRPTNTLVPVNDEERFNVPSAQRKILLPGSIWSLTKGSACGDLGTCPKLRR